MKEPLDPRGKHFSWVKPTEKERAFKVEDLGISK